MSIAQILFSSKSRFYSALKPQLLSTVFLGSSIWSFGLNMPAAQAKNLAYCQRERNAIAQKNQLLISSLGGDKDAKNRYQKLIKSHAKDLQKCRSQTWPPSQGIWLRLYACDIRNGYVEEILDRIVNRGYNQVYIEILGDSQVLLPAADNPTPWPSIVRSRGSQKVDLLAQVIQKGRARGLKVYAWMFSMNFGYGYSLRTDRKQAIARNGKGQKAVITSSEGSQAFVDPYSPQARGDYSKLVRSVLRRKPDGVLFDYIRYPRGAGSNTVASQVRDLWIYGDSAFKALYNRGTNNKGRVLIQRFVSRGYISSRDIRQVDQLYRNEGSPMWHGRNPSANEMRFTPEQRQPSLQWDLWQLSVAHAAQGVLDFLATAMYPVQKQGLKAGAVFFPDANQPIRQVGYDSRLQPWDRFPKNMEWHPMLYAICNNSACLSSQLQRVLKQSTSQTRVSPVLAGIWGKSWNNKPPLEVQMSTLRPFSSKVKSVSHFAFSWQEPKFTRERQSCAR
jgi:hypothetical protein